MCSRKCCDVDKCNKPFLDSGDASFASQFNFSIRPTTVQPQVMNGGQSTKDSMEFSTTSSFTSTPRTILTSTTAPSSEEESTVATMQITEVPSTSDQRISTTTLLAKTEEDKTTIDSDLSGETAIITLLATTKENRETIDSESSGETATIALLATTKEDTENIASELSGETA